MAKIIKVWSGTEWVEVGIKAALPSDYVDTTALNSALSSYKQAISANTTLVAGRRYFVDTTAARTLTLPASPTLGQEVVVIDATGTAATNNITILRNGGKINGLTEDAILDVNQGTSVFTYTGTALGWRFD
jgi:hypothetical protein